MPPIVAQPVGVNAPLSTPPPVERVQLVTPVALQPTFFNRVAKWAAVKAKGTIDALWPRIHCYQPNKALLLIDLVKPPAIHKKAKGLQNLSICPNKRHAVLSLQRFRRPRPICAGMNGLPRWPFRRRLRREDFSPGKYPKAV